MPTYNDGRLFKKYKKNCNLFIETGTYIGDVIESALNAEFELGSPIRNTFACNFFKIEK